MKTLTVVTGCLLLIGLAGCTGSWSESYFEKRYLAIEIPGYEESDYVRLLESGNPDLRYLAAVNLMEQVEDEDLEPGAPLERKLEVLLSDASDKVRAVVAYVFLRTKGATSAQPALMALAADPSSAVRVEAIATLASQYSESSEAIQVVLDHVDDPSVLVRLVAIGLLPVAKESPMRGEAVKRLLAKQSYAIEVERLMMIATLGTIGTPDEVGALLTDLLGSPSVPMVTVALASIKQLEIASAVGELPGLARRGVVAKTDIIETLAVLDTSSAYEQLAAFMDDADRDVRSAAINAIAARVDDRGKAALIRRLAEEERKLNPDSAAVSEFADIGDLGILVPAVKQTIEREKKEGEIWTGFVLRLLQSTDNWENMVGLLLLPKEKGRPLDRNVIPAGDQDPRYLPHLERLARQPSPLVRGLALEAIGYSHDLEALSVLDRALRGTPFGIRAVAIDALGSYVGNTEDRNALAVLDRTVKSAPVALRARTIAALGNYAASTGDPKVLPLLEQTVMTAPANVRVAAIEALGRYLGRTGDAGPLPLLERLVEDPNLGTRTAAIEALCSYVGKTSDLAPLQRLYATKDRFVPAAYRKNDKNFVVRRLIDAKICGLEGSLSTLERRTRELADPQPPTRLIAALSLAASGETAALPVLFEALEHGGAAERDGALAGFESYSFLPTEHVTRLAAIGSRTGDKAVADRIKAVVAKLQGKA